MANRTYLPTLISLLKFICTYITKHRDKIVNAVGTEHASKVDAITTACELFMNVALPVLEPGV